MLESIKAVVEKGEEYIPQMTLDDYGLGGVDCPECGNTGHIIRLEDGIPYSQECQCMKKRRSLRSIRNSGMADMLERYTFGKFETPDKHREKMKEVAERFAASDEGWFYISGRPGCGKSHLCAAICSALISRNKEVRYMSWRDESAALKSCITDYESYQSRIQKLKDVPVLYIDDFWKGDITEADIKLSFELLNARYLDSKKRTILSSEVSIGDVVRIDEAIGSRIYERSRGYRVKGPDENWRLRK